MNNYNKSSKEYVPQTQGCSPVTTGAKKKQIELSDDDIALLNMSQFSDAAWEDVARKHSFDPASREPIPNSKNRGYLAQHKKWEPKPQVGGVLTTKKAGR